MEPGQLGWLVVLGLATWRLSSMLVFEYGPFGLFEGIRRVFGIKHVEGRVVTMSHRNVLSCVWCTSVWVALALVLLPIPPVALWVLAVSTLAVVVQERLVGGGR